MENGNLTTFIFRRVGNKVVISVPKNTTIEDLIKLMIILREFIFYIIAN